MSRRGAKLRAARDSRYGPMDNLTHTLTGLALARAGFKRFSPHGTLLMIAAANIPDIDMVSMLWGRLASFQVHRGYTHSLLCLPLMAAAAVLFTSIVMRRRLPWARAWLIACVGVASHLLLDTSMSYGVRLLLPFSSSWYYLDLYSLIDWVVLGVLAIAWLAPMLSRLVSDEIGGGRSSGQGFAVFALAFILFYGGFRATMHSRVLAQLESRIYDETLSGPAIGMGAFPDSLNPLLWHSVVESEHAYRLYEAGAYGNFDPASGELLYKTWSEKIKRISETPAFRYSLYFARFPYWQEIPAPGTDGNEAITLSDLRFGRPGESFFNIRALIDGSGRLQQVRFVGSTPKPGE